MIKHSLEWNAKRDQLTIQIRALPYNPDLRRMIKNIDTMVDQLSKAEVAARSGRKQPTEELDKVNAAIQTLEEWIMMGALLS